MNINVNENELFIGYNVLLGYDHEMIKEVEEHVILYTKKNKNIKNNYKRDNSEEDKEEYPKHIKIEFIQQENNLHYDANKIKFQLKSKNMRKKAIKMKRLKLMQREADEEFVPKDLVEECIVILVSCQKKINLKKNSHSE